VDTNGSDTTDGEKAGDILQQQGAIEVVDKQFENVEV
jgi:hypothetical protein